MAKSSRVSSAPGWLTADAKAIFKAEAKVLHAAGMLTTADVGHLARYTAAEAVLRRSIAALEAAPMLATTSGGIRANPLGSTTVALLSALRGYAGDLGLSPASRSAIRRAVTADEEADEELRRLLG